jgi:xanthine dehydrogenase YagS FAD-binding subunit
MKAFRFLRPRDAAEATAALAAQPGAVLKAGGIDLLDRMKEHVDEPGTVVGLVDAKGLEAVHIEEDGSIRIGARVTLATLAASETCRRFLPTLAEAAGLAASPQIRNRATIAGNVAQHTRCGYYRHESFPCLKRGADHCPVKKEGGVQDTAGVFDLPCVAAHPSSLAPVLGSLDAELHVRTPQGPGVVAFGAAWRTPERGRASDLDIGADPAVIEAIRIPARVEKQFVGYAEVRQKAAYDWALVSCAVRYEADAAGKVRDPRIWFGSVAPTPFHATRAETAIAGSPSTDETARLAAEAAFAEAQPLPGAAYKLKLAKVALRRAFAAARGRS